MKNFKEQIRRLIASFLIQWTLDVLPNDNEYKLRFVIFNKKNIDQL